MTSPASPDALDALRKSLAMAASDPGNVIRADGTKVGYKGDRCMGGWIADALIAAPLAPILDKADSAEAAEARADRLSAEVEALRDLADGACFHFFCCGAGIHTQEDECGELVPSMAALARAIGFRNDPATTAEIASVREPHRKAALARAAVKAETEGSDHG